ncbi:MAG: diacylglycerol kinase family protein [Thermaerobacter sp.]|nr:diacylglycerol kinase family protein [Thermaerobacter sp.]
MKPRNSFWAAFRFAGGGVWHTLRNQRNFRVHVSVAIVVVCIGWIFNLSRVSWALIVLAMALVLGLELVNTGLEALTDLASPGYHRLAGAAKDAAAGAVLVAAAASVVLGLIVYQPQLTHFRQHFMVRWHQNPALVIGLGVCLIISLALLWGFVPARQRGEGGQNQNGDTP